MKAPPQIEFVDRADAKALVDVAAGLRASSIASNLSPGRAELSKPDVPTTPEAFAGFFANKVCVAAAG
ncbi:hypothetical protein [Bradyrhizobium sp. STM 3561]|uniref:hypothetical protein n=1 Tax=unclassified Bradyrhizobium TaxID=2631580 RepID=UPI00388FF571